MNNIFTEYLRMTASDSTWSRVARNIFITLENIYDGDFLLKESVTFSRIYLQNYM